MRTILVTIIAAFILSAPAHAQQITTGPGSIVQTGNGNTATVGTTPTPAPDTAPTLTTEQKLTITNALLAVENAQLKAQQIAQDYERARAALQQLIATVTPSGYQLVQDPQQGLMLAKVPEPTKPEPTKPEPTKKDDTKK